MKRFGEMEDIFFSYEWLIRERLEALDRLSRKMYKDMSLAKIKAEESREYIQQRMAELIQDISRKGDEAGD